MKSVFWTPLVFELYVVGNLLPAAKMGGVEINISGPNPRFGRRETASIACSVGRKRGKFSFFVKMLHLSFVKICL